MKSGQRELIAFGNTVLMMTSRTTKTTTMMMMMTMVRMIVFSSRMARPRSGPDPGPHPLFHNEDKNLLNG